MTTRIDNAINVFLEALKEGTLAKGTCTACAVGNLVAKGLGGKIKHLNNYFHCDKENNYWSYLFMTKSEGEQRINPSFLEEDYVRKNIDATEFTWQELAKIEQAFETNTKIGHSEYRLHTKEEIRQDQIKGLEAVVCVMLDFDDCKEAVQEVFTSKAELILN